MSERETAELIVLSRIREAIGDEGRLMQDELVQRIQDIVDVLHEFMRYQISDFDRKQGAAREYCKIRRKAYALFPDQSK